MTRPAEAFRLMREDTREACLRYVAEQFAPEDQLLRELRSAMAERGLPEIYISADEGRLLQVLLRAVGARRVVELGTLGGYSAIWMARALPEDGELISVEREAAYAQLARQYIKRAGLADRVRVLEGEAARIIAQLAERGPYDAVFIDADKESYPLYLDWCLSNVRPGGLVIADNAFREGDVVNDDTDDPQVLGIQELNRRMARDERLTSIIVPTRDGVAIGLVNRG